MSKTRTINLDFQNTILEPPITGAQMYAQAASNDEATIEHWRNTWVTNIRENKKHFGSFADRSIGKLYKTWEGKPSILCGAGPSLRHNVGLLKSRPTSMCLVACLHSFHFLEDNDANVDYYVTLDAGPVTIEEVYEGGKRTPEEYWELTKNRKLIAYIGSSPELLKKWQGEIYFYNAPIPSDQIKNEIREIEPFDVWISNGGNVLGACFYFAKAFLGSGVNIFIGADFCFDMYAEKIRFHPWDSKYDAKLGHVVSAVDVFGNRVVSWQSYLNFRDWFISRFLAVPGIYINATEGGTLGAFREGNLACVKQMWLEDVYHVFNDHTYLADQAFHPEGDNNLLLM